MLTHSYKAAAAQFDVKRGDTDANLFTLREMTAEAKDRAVKLLVLPEMWSCGFDNENLAEHARKTPEILAEVQKLAKRYDMLIAGSVPESEEGKIYNTLYAADRDGSIAGSYRKIHLFSLTGEEKFFTAGDRPVICKTSLGMLGLMICYDLRFPELCRALTLKGAPLVIVSAQWPRIRISRWDILARARAIENQIYIIACNRCGKENSTVFGGHSLIADPSGEILAKAKAENCICCGEILPERLAEIRSAMPSLEERMPHAYTF